MNPQSIVHNTDCMTFMRTLPDNAGRDKAAGAIRTIHARRRCILATDENLHPQRLQGRGRDAMARHDKQPAVFRHG